MTDKKKIYIDTSTFNNARDLGQKRHHELEFLFNSYSNYSIYCSHVHLNELIQPFTSKYHFDRYSVARTMDYIFKGNCIRYGTEIFINESLALLKKETIFDSVYGNRYELFPQIDIIQNLVDGNIKKLSSITSLSNKEIMQGKIKIDTKTHNMLIENKELFMSNIRFTVNAPISDYVVENFKELFIDYLLGRCTKNLCNKILNDDIGNPLSLIKNYELYKRTYDEILCIPKFGREFSNRCSNGELFTESSLLLPFVNGSDTLEYINYREEIGLKEIKKTFEHITELNRKLRRDCSPLTETDLLNNKNLILSGTFIKNKMEIDRIFYEGDRKITIARGDLGDSMHLYYTPYMDYILCDKNTYDLLNSSNYSLMSKVYCKIDDIKKEL